METFSQTIERWHDFYLMVGTASATLIGLLFVSLSLNVQVFRREERGDLGLLAMQTFNSFVYVLLFAIFFLIPHQGPVGLGLPLLAIGGLGLASTAQKFLITRQRHRAWGRTTVAQRFILPLISLVSVVVIAVSVLLGQTGGLYWLVPVMILLIASASRNAWDLLIGVRDDQA